MYSMKWLYTTAIQCFSIHCLTNLRNEHLCLTEYLSMEIKYKKRYHWIEAWELWGRTVSLIDFSVIVSGCSNTAICWLLWGGLVRYIFTVCVMINFLLPPCSLKQLSFKSPPLLRYRPLSQLLLSAPVKAHLLNVYFAFTLFSWLN